MKTSKEFFDRLGNDPAFAEEVSRKVADLRASGVTVASEAVIPVAAEYGYEVTADQIAQKSEESTAEMSEADLGKIAGGTTCFTWVVVSTILAISSVGVTTKTIEE